MALAVPGLNGLLVFAAAYALAGGPAAISLVSKRRIHDCLHDAPELLLAWADTWGARVPEGLYAVATVRSILRAARRIARVRFPFAADASRGALLVLVVAVSLLVGATLGVFTVSLRAAVMGLVAVPVLLLLNEHTFVKANTAKAETAMPEAFNALSMSLASGHSLAQAMGFVGAHAEEPIKTEFMQVAHAVDCGIPLTEALDDMLCRLDAPGLDFVALALKVSRRTGAPLGELLGEASAMVGERIELLRRLEVKTSQARMSAQLVAAMPVAMIALLSLMSSDFRRGIAEPVGMVSVLVALVLNVFAWLIIRRIMKVRV